MLEQLRLTEEVIEPLHRVGKLASALPSRYDHRHSAQPTLACSIALRFFEISATFPFRASFWAFLADASSLRFFADGVTALD